MRVPDPPTHLFTLHVLCTSPKRIYIFYVDCIGTPRKIYSSHNIHPFNKCTFSTNDEQFLLKSNTLPNHYITHQSRVECTLILISESFIHIIINNFVLMKFTKHITVITSPLKQFRKFYQTNYHPLYSQYTHKMQYWWYNIEVSGYVFFRNPPEPNFSF